jgi:hypothetical protein
MVKIAGERAGEADLRRGLFQPGEDTHRAQAGSGTGRAVNS